MILILELLRPIKKGEFKMFRPQYNDDYFYITDDGLVRDAIWEEDEIDLMRLSIGNCFKTAEVAEFVIEMLKGKRWTE